MLVHQAFRFELDPNDRVRSRFASHAGASRFVFNWGLALVEERLDIRARIRAEALKELLSDDDVEVMARRVEIPWTFYSLRREWNIAKRDVAPWWAENSKFAYESGLKALADALAKFQASKKGTRKGPTMGFPRRKKRYARRSCRFWVGAGLSVVDERHVRLPRIGVVRSKEKTTELLSLLGTGMARILNATLSEEAGRWFVSFCVERERCDLPARFPDAVVGVDLGVHHLAALSNGELVANPRALNRYQRKMARLSRQLSRRQKGSKRRARTKAQLARCHRRVRCTRADALHQLSSRLASTYGTIVVEDLNVAGMTRATKGSHRRQKSGLNRAVLDTAPAELRRQLSYKLAWRGGRLVVADRWFASSRLCSSCGAVKAKLTLSTRMYRCEECGLEMDRDLNAARNLAALCTTSPGGARRPKADVEGIEVTGQLTVRCSLMTRQDGRGQQPRKSVLVGKAN